MQAAEDYGDNGYVLTGRTIKTESSHTQILC